MRRFRSCWDGLRFASQHNPPELVETVMLSLAMASSLLWWIRQDWQYLALSSSYILGATASILVREIVAPSPRTHLIRFATISCLIGLVVVLFLTRSYTLRSLNLA